jgi:hypothetical protein
VGRIGSRNRNTVRCRRALDVSHSAHFDGRFSTLIAPSRHSGLNSLSPKEPNSSETMMSAGSGTSICLISPKMRFTRVPHSSSFRSCSLRHISRDTASRTTPYVTNALAFFSTAYTLPRLLDLSIAARQPATSGPRPAPTT